MRSTLSRDCSSAHPHKYYQRMLTAIEQIQSHLLANIQPQCSQIARSTCHSNKTSRKRARHRPKAPIAFDSRVSIHSRQDRESQLRQSESKTVNLISKSAASRINFSTPQNAKKGSSLFFSAGADLMDGFNECPLDRVETVRRTHNDDSLFESTDSKIIKDQVQLTNLKARGDRKSTSVYVKKTKMPKCCQPNNKENHQLLTLKDKDLNSLSQQFAPGVEQFAQLSELQRQFQGCLMKKRGTLMDKGLNLREKMAQLGYRIAKLRQRQTRLPMYQT